MVDQVSELPYKGDTGAFLAIERLEGIAKEQMNQKDHQTSNQVLSFPINRTQCVPRLRASLPEYRGPVVVHQVTAFLLLVSVA